MVHTFCKLGKNNRGCLTTEFYIDGKPQVYCYGRTDLKNWKIVARAECKSCPNWVYGEQCGKDFQKEMERMASKFTEKKQLRHLPESYREDGEA